MFVLAALILLGVLIIGHEAGHYFAARACGIAVQEFSMGMGPLLASWTNRNGTQFSVRLIPVGGFCRFYGEDEEDGDPRSFGLQPVLARMATVVCGPMMNYVLGVLIIVLLLSAIGLETTVPVVGALEENARAAGLMVGDQIISVNGVAIEGTADVVAQIADYGGAPVVMRVRRDGGETELTITPFYDEALQRYRVGFSFGSARVRTPLWQSLPFSVGYNAESAGLILDALKNLIFRGEGIEDVSGPVGLVYTVDQVSRSGGLEVFFELAALISVNLGVMNLLPIPGLDGSRLLFMLIEAIRKKPVPRELEGRIHLIGYALLAGLLVVLTYKDILRIFVG